MVGTIVKTFLLAAVLALSTFVQAQKVEPGGKPDLPAPLASAVQDHGLRVLDKDGTPLVSLWLARSVPTSKKDVEGANYPQLTSSLLMGIIRYETEGKDFRGQAIPKGTYTLRYGLLPNDGNHMGVAPNRDFLLLLPLVSDSDPAAVYTDKQLHRASAKVAGGTHPTVLSLVPAEGDAGTVSVSPEGYLVLHVFWTTSQGDLPAALIVKGVAQP